MADYTFTKLNAVASKLTTEAIAAGIPALYANGSGDQITVFTSRDLTPAEQTTLAAVVANHDGTPRKLRDPVDVLTDLNNATKITDAQLVATWNDLTSGSDPKIAEGSGVAKLSIMVLHFIAVGIGGLTTPEKRQAQKRAIAFYIYDNPKYLVNPPFAPIVNIPGDEPVT